MKSFLVWLEENKNAEDTVLSALGLDKDGLATPLDSFDPVDLMGKLEGLGFWQSISSEKQHSVKAMIMQGRGTVGEMIDEMSEMDTGGGGPSLSPPMG